MANLTNYAEKKMLDHTLGQTSFTMPVAVYLAAFTASPGETGSLSAEVTGGDYARVEITSKMASAVLGTGVATNSSTITFPVPTAAWGAITHVGICDASTAGNVLIYLPLTSAQVILSGSAPLEFIPGALNLYAVISNPDGLTQYTGKKWLDHLLGKSAFTMPTNIYLGLFSADPGATGSLTNEIATGGYARQIITDAMDETDSETGIARNASGIVFPDPTASYNVTHFGVMDALSSGNMLLRKARGSTLQVVSGAAAVQVSAQQLALRAA